MSYIAYCLQTEHLLQMHLTNFWDEHIIIFGCKLLQCFFFYFWINVFITHNPFYVFCGKEVVGKISPVKLYWYVPMQHSVCNRLWAKVWLLLKHWCACPTIKYRSTVLQKENLNKTGKKWKALLLRKRFMVANSYAIMYLQ